MQKKSKAQHRIYGAVAFGAKVLMAMTVWMAVYAVPAGAQTLPQSGNLNGSYTAPAGNYSGPYTLTGDVTITVASGTATINGVISGGSSYTLTKAGAGTLTLNGNNTYGGDTHIPTGTLTLGTNGSIASSGQVKLYNYGTLNLASGNKTIKGLSSGSSDAKVTLGSNTLTVNNSGYSTTFSGVISGSGGLTLTGTGGMLNLTGNNTYTGKTTINAGDFRLIGNGSIANSNQVVINGSGALSISLINSSSTTVKGLHSNSPSAKISLGTKTLVVDNTGWTTTFEGVIEGMFPGGYLNLIGDGGTLNLLGNNTYTGGTTIGSGSTLYIGYNSTTGNVNSDIAINGGTLCFYRSNDIVFLKVISGSGGKIEKYGNGNLGFPLSNTYTGTTYIYGGMVTISQVGAIGNVYVSEGSTLRFSRSSAYTYDKVISGAGDVDINGSANITFTGVHTYTGTTTINLERTLFLSATGKIENSKRVVIGGSCTLDISAGNKTIKGLQGISSAMVVLDNRTLTVNTTEDCTYDGTFTGAGGIIKTGSATLTLTRSNIGYTGATTINEGTLALSSSADINNSSGVVLNDWGKLDITAGNKTIKSLNSHVFSTVTLGNRTLTIGTSGGSDGGGTCNGKFSGTGGSITKQGTGNLIFNSESNATGTFTCNQGSVTLSGFSKWSGNFVKGAGCTLTVDGPFTIGGTLNMQGGTTNFTKLTNPLPPVHSRLSATGALTKSGTNTLNITSIGSLSSYVLISAASGVNTDNFTVTGAVGVLSATATQLSFIPTTGFIAVTDIADLPETAAINAPLILRGMVIPVNATNQTIVWEVTNPGSTGGAITSDSIFTATALGTATLKATIANGVSPVEAYEQTFTLEVVTATLDGTVDLSGIPIFGETLTATPDLTTTPDIPDLGALTYEWLRDGNVIVGAPNQPVYTLAAGDVGAAISVRVTAANCTGSVTSESTATVEKAPQDQPAAPTLADKTATAITLATVAGCEYSRDYGTWQSSPTFAGLSPNTPYLFTQRYAETATHYASPESPAALFTTDDSDNPLYTITATVNDTDHGTITPYGAATVEEGDNITFHITAYAGYHIETVLVDGANNPNAVATGTYTFQNVTEDHTIHVVFAEGVGIGDGDVETGRAPSLQVYPNPTSGKLTICDMRCAICDIAVFDIMGRIIITHYSHTHYSLPTLDLSHLPSGIYFLRITTENGVVTKKVVKQ